MSRVDDRRQRQQAEATAQARMAEERPNISPTRFNPDPQAWDSRCPGSRLQWHERSGTERGDLWACRWCGQFLKKRSK